MYSPNNPEDIILKWERIRPLPTQSIPFPRKGHSTVTHKNKIFLFGGMLQNLAQNDFWCFFPDLLKWRKIDGSTNVRPQSNNKTKPTTRAGHSACVWKKTHQMIIFGGHSGQGEYQYNDVWAIDLTKKQPTWELFFENNNVKKIINKTSTTPAPTTFPQPRYGHSAVCCGDSMFIFGGMGNGQFFDDLWEFNLASKTWSKIELNLGSETQVTPKRSSHSCCLWSQHEFLIFGGTNGEYLCDTWLFDAEKKTMEKIFIQGELPAGRSKHAAVSFPHPRLNKPLMLVHGGTRGLYKDTDLWLFEIFNSDPSFPNSTPNTSITQNTSTISSSSNTTNRYGKWRKLKIEDNSGMTIPMSRDSHSASIISAGGSYEFWIFGGVGTQNSLLDDIWKISLFDFLDNYDEVPHNHNKDEENQFPKTKFITKSSSSSPEYNKNNNYSEPFNLVDQESNNPNNNSNNSISGSDFEVNTINNKVIKTSKHASAFSSDDEDAGNAGNDELKEDELQHYRESNNNNSNAKSNINKISSNLNKSDEDAGIMFTRLNPGIDQPPEPTSETNSTKNNSNNNSHNHDESNEHDRDDNNDVFFFSGVGGGDNDDLEPQEFGHEFKTNSKGIINISGEGEDNFLVEFMRRIEFLEQEVVRLKKKPKTSKKPENAVEKPTENDNENENEEEEEDENLSEWKKKMESRMEKMEKKIDQQNETLSSLNEIIQKEIACRLSGEKRQQSYYGILSKQMAAQMEMQSQHYSKQLMLMKRIVEKSEKMNKKPKNVVVPPENENVSNQQTTSNSSSSSTTITEPSTTNNQESPLKNLQLTTQELIMNK